jgi:N-acetylglucosaminyldiphosphoundecaprenol N-acetyl-beta-D-mannosaminyltransferase
MQNAGLEWLHRLAADPKRLWKRYLVTNTIFIFSIFFQLIGIKKF